jgi:hypothetical protein
MPNTQILTSATHGFADFNNAWQHLAISNGRNSRLVRLMIRKDYILQGLLFALQNFAQYLYQA